MPGRGCCCPDPPPPPPPPPPPRTAMPAPTDRTPLREPRPSATPDLAVAQWGCRSRAPAPARLRYPPLEPLSPVRAASGLTKGPAPGGCAGRLLAGECCGPPPPPPCCCPEQSHPSRNLRRPDPAPFRPSHSAHLAEVPSSRLSRRAPRTLRPPLLESHSRTKTPAHAARVNGGFGGQHSRPSGVESRMKRTRVALARSGPRPKARENVCSFGYPNVLELVRL